MTPPTAPGRLPLLGHALGLLRAPLTTLARARQLGEVVRLQLGPLPAYLVNSPELIQQILVRDSRRFDRGMLFDKASEVVGNGLVTSNGRLHRRQRRAMQPAFRRERLAGYTEVMCEQIHRLVDRWQPGQRLALERECVEMALTVVAKALFNSDAGDRAVTEIQRSLPAIVSGVLVQTVAPSWWGRLPTRGNRRFRQARQRLLTMVDDVIDPYRTDGVDHGDLLSALVAARHEDTGEPMSPEQLRDEVITVLLAGTETTAASLCWLLHELARHPEVTRRVHAEVDAVLAGQPVTPAHLPRLRYSRQVVSEVLRLHSPAWFILRRATQPVQLGPVTLAPGDEVVYSSTALHRDPAWFERPLEFDPDRWSPERAAELSRQAFLPFGAGPHKCIGDVFAQTELLVALATIGSRWRLEPVPGSRIRLRGRATLRPRTLPMVAWRRTPAPASSAAEPLRPAQANCPHHQARDGSGGGPAAESLGRSDQPGKAGASS